MALHFEEFVVGDTVYAHVTPLEKRLNARPPQGVVKLEIPVKNQGDSEIFKDTHDVMVLTHGN
ncbi:MAG: hypothetical protein WCH32_04185 [Pseudomonadota bacterium]